MTWCSDLIHNIWAFYNTAKLSLCFDMIRLFYGSFMTWLNVSQLHSRAQVFSSRRAEWDQHHNILLNNETNFILWDLCCFAILYIASWYSGQYCLPAFTVVNLVQVLTVLVQNFWMYKIWEDFGGKMKVRMTNWHVIHPAAGPSLHSPVHLASSVQIAKVLQLIELSVPNRVSRCPRTARVGKLESTRPHSSS